MATQAADSTRTPRSWAPTLLKRRGRVPLYGSGATAMVVVDFVTRPPSMRFRRKVNIWWRHSPAADIGRARSSAGPAAARRPAEACEVIGKTTVGAIESGRLPATCTG